MTSEIKDATIEPYATPSQSSRKMILPSDPDGINDNRADWAESAIKAFRAVTGTDAEDALSDLLADLMHWTDRNGYDFDAELCRGRGHYQAETGLTWDDVNEVVRELHPNPAEMDRHAERVALCESALQNYTDSDANANLVDLLADARHWCDRHELNFGELDRIAYQHYLAERNGCDSSLRICPDSEE